jgi:hypothetical protein
MAIIEDNFHLDAPSSVAKVNELVARAKKSIESGVSSFRDAAEFLAEAQELGVSQRQLADGVGKSAAWVNALLKWHDCGYLGSQSAARHPLKARY